MMTSDVDTLIERIEHGTTTALDARLVFALVGRLARYERALSEIAVYGGGRAAMLAALAIAGEGHDRTGDRA